MRSLLVGCVFFDADNMAQVLKEVVASQKFLSGLRTLSHYVELQRKQLERLRPIINKSFMSVDMASRVVNSFLKKFGTTECSTI